MGIDLKVKQPGGLTSAQLHVSERHITILQRKHARIGAGLGKTTGWIHRLELKHRGVKMLSGVQYERIDDAGLHIRINNEPMLLDVENIIICAGQEENHDLYDSLRQAGQSVHLLGGAYKAIELDAKQAIEQATRLACVL